MNPYERTATGAILVTPPRGISKFPEIECIWEPEGSNPEPRFDEQGVLHLVQSKEGVRYNIDWLDEVALQVNMFLFDWSKGISGVTWKEKTHSFIRGPRGKWASADARTVSETIRAQRLWDNLFGGLLEAAKAAMAGNLLGYRVYKSFDPLWGMK